MKGDPSEAVKNGKAMVDMGSRGAQEFTRAAAHGVTGGAAAEIQGGDFGSGFASSFAASASGSALGASGAEGSAWYGTTGNLEPQMITRTAIAAAVGGTVAEIGGGKFGNGATTAAIQHLVNAEGLEALDEFMAENSPKLHENRGLEPGGVVYRSPVDDSLQYTRTEGKTDSISINEIDAHFKMLWERGLLHGMKGTRKSTLPNGGTIPNGPSFQEYRSRVLAYWHGHPLGSPSSGGWFSPKRYNSNDADTDMEAAQVVGRLYTIRGPGHVERVDRVPGAKRGKVTTVVEPD